MIGICGQDSPVCIPNEWDDKMSVVGEKFLNMHEGEYHMLWATLGGKSAKVHSHLIVTYPTISK